MLWFKKKKKGPPGHQTNFQKTIDQNQSFFYSWPNQHSGSCDSDAINLEFSVFWGSWRTIFIQGFSVAYGFPHIEITVSLT